MIISASRRTDIPAFYSEWFMNRIKEGYVLTRNPINYKQISKIPLTKEAVDCFVFWSKDPLPMLDKLKVLDEGGFSYYFQFTITPYGRDLEKNLGDKAEIIETFMKLADKIGAGKVVWRYDPIIISNKYSATYHIEKFEELCEKLRGYTKNCMISFVDRYKKLQKAMDREGIGEVSQTDMCNLAFVMAEAGKKNNIEVKSCCEDAPLALYGVESGSCIDPAIIESICGHSLKIKKDLNQRQGCNCMPSTDIGVYNTCKNGCIYCYANHSMESVEKNWKAHNSVSDILIGTVGEGEKIKEKNYL